MQYSEAEDEQKAYMLFVAIGIGYLFPFSALTQPVDYWHDLFPDFNVEFSITVSYMWINLLVLAFLVFVGDKPIFKRSKCSFWTDSVPIHYCSSIQLT